LWILRKKGSDSLIVALATNRDRMDFDHYAIEFKDKIKKSLN
jgi:hypothetical protein